MLARDPADHFVEMSARSIDDGIAADPERSPVRI